jgi:hypothetical protein
MDIRQVMAGRPEPQNPGGQSQNLVNLSKTDRANHAAFAANVAGVRQSIILGVLSVLAAFFTGYAYERYLAVGLSLWVTIVASLFFIAFSILHVFLSKKTSRRVEFLVLEAVAMVAPFFAVRAWYLLAAVVLTFLFLLWGYFESKSELDYGTEIRFYKVTHAVTAKLVTALLLFAVFFLVAVRGSEGNFFMSEGSFSGLFGGTAALFTDFYPTISVNGSFQEFVTSVAREQLSGVSAFNSLSPGDQAAATEQTTAALATNFSRALGVTITPTSTTRGVIYGFIVGSLQNWHNRYGPWFVIAWALVLFTILRSIGVVFILVAQFFAMIFYEILLATGIIRVVEHPQTKEEVEFT